MGTMPKVTTTDPWKLAQAYFNRSAQERTADKNRESREDIAAQNRDMRMGIAGMQEGGRNARHGDMMDYRRDSLEQRGQQHEDRMGVQRDRLSLARDRFNRGGDTKFIEDSAEARARGSARGRGASSSALSGNKGIRAFLDTLQENGVNNKFALSAIAAHLQHESRGNFGAFNANDDGDGPSGGGLQWHDSRRDGSGRFSSLKRYAAEEGSDWRDPRVQARFWLQEGKGAEKGNFARLMNARSYDEANDAMTSIQRFDEKKLPNERRARGQTTYAWGRTLFGEKPPSKTELAQQEQQGAVQKATLANGDVEDDEKGVFRDQSGRRYRVFYPKMSYLQQMMHQSRKLGEVDESGQSWRYKPAPDLPVDQRSSSVAWRMYIDPPGGGGQGQGGSTPVAPDQAKVDATNGSAGSTRVTGSAFDDDLDDEDQEEVTTEEDEEE